MSWKLPGTTSGITCLAGNFAESLRRSGGWASGPGGLDVGCDLLHELLLARERPLLAEPLPEREAERPPVEIAREVEEKRLDAPLDAAVVGVDADAHSGAHMRLSLVEQRR